MQPPSRRMRGSRGRLAGTAVLAGLLAAGLPAAAATEQPAPPQGLTLETYLLQERHFPPQGTDKPWCELGGESRAAAVLDFNVPLLKRLTVRADDLLEVVLRLKLARQSGVLAGARLEFHRMLRPAGAGELKAGADYAAEPMLSTALADVMKDGWIKAPGFAPAMRKYVAGQWHDHGVLMRLVGAQGPAMLRLHGVTSPGSGYWARNLPMLDVTLRRHENHFLFDWPVRPRDGVWCVMKDGRLWYGGKRLRLWGVCRGASYNPRQVHRVRKMGFNAIRLWSTYPYSDESARRGVIDETQTEQLDRYVAEMKAQGMWVMYPGLMSNPCGLGRANKGLLADDSWLAGGDDWDQWKQAVTAKGAPLKFLHYFDERLMRIRKRHARNVLDHVNPYTRRRFAEEEAVAMYEVWNENGFLKWNLERGFESWPAYFRDKLRRRWNDWLRNRYGGEAGLKKAWGRLEKGESLDAGTIALAPLVQDRKKHPEQRGRDFVRFCIELVDASNRDFVAYCRTLAPHGVGVNVVPFSMDTQYRNNLPWMFANARGEVVCFGMYYHTMQSELTRPPAMGGLDTNTVAGRATVLYEVNCGKPNPYRAEFPLRLAALASWLDWDGAFFHYFQEPLWYWKRINPDEEYLNQALPYQYDSADVHFETDATMCSSMAAAGQIFLHELLPPAASPVIYRVGGRAIFGYDHFGGVWMKPKTFTDGAAAELHGEEDSGITVEGAEPPADGRITGPVASGEHVLWDWPNGRLIVDAPACKVYVGRPAPVRFRDGIALSGVTTKFAYFAMVSADGKPLVGPDASRRIRIAAGWNNLNSGYEIDPQMLRRQGFVHPGERMKAVRQKGHPPVVADVVPYTVHFPTELDYRFEGYDFALRKCREQTGRGTNVVRHDGSEVFSALLYIERRGKAADVPVRDAPPWPKATGAGAEPGRDAAAAVPAELFGAWRAMPAPPITPYSGPFGGEARAFVGRLDPRSAEPNARAAQKAFFDWQRLGTYDPQADARPINEAFEKATLEDWKRMGYNCAYKGNAFTFRSGRWLKAHGMLGAIDQTLWASRKNPPLSWDGKPGKTYGDASGSFFHPDNFQAGVTLLANYVTNFGDADMLKVGGTYVTSSWDEVGLRTRSTIDYRPEAVVEYRRFLRDVWFGDESPGRDTNGDGRTYNAFAGEKLRTWEQVAPPVLSPGFYREPQAADEKWRRPGAFKLWVDFHRYYTFEYFRRVGEAASQKAGKRLECYPFPIGFIMWPGANGHWGVSAYWNCRLNAVVNVEQCWPDSPAMSLNYAVIERLARKYRNVVMGWSWFYFGKEAGDMYDGPYDHGRALARMMGRRVDGIHHWLYSPIYRGRDRRQRRQLAYWHNFLACHYRSFLSRSAPARAQVALLMPDWTGYFYRLFQYPKMGWAYTFQGLAEAQVPCEIVTEEELELQDGALDGYKVLYVVGSEWSTPTIRRRIEAFLDRGGVVCANVDSLSLDIPTGRRGDFLEKTFGVRIERRHKNSFLPSAQDAEEEAWAAELNGWGKAAWLQGHHVHKPGAYSKLYKDEAGQCIRDEEQWKQLDAAMARMPRRVRGIEQAPLDMRTPPKVRYAEGVGPAQPTVTWGEVDAARVLRGRPIAWWGKEVCGVETDKTVWLGTRPGMSLHAVSPRMSMNRTTEPCNPYVTHVSPRCQTHRPYVDVISYAARKAGVRRLVTVALDGRIPCNLEVLPRVDAAGNLMCFVINHDDTDATCQVTVDPEHLAVPAMKGARAWDLLHEKLIEDGTDGRFALHVPAGQVAVFLLGRPEALAPIQAAQKRLNAMDLSVPKYFLDRPELNAPEYNTPIPPIGK